MNKNGLFLFLVLGGLAVGFTTFQNRPSPSPPTAELDQALTSPIQASVVGSPFLESPYQGYTLEATDTYTLQARVVGIKPYTSGREADLSPLDLALIWGPLLQEPYLSKLTYWQSNRWYHYRWGSDLDTSAGFVGSHSANTHIIIPPHREELRSILLGLKPGDFVHLSGYLVRVQANDGWHWKSSRTRQDSGNGACELMYVTEAKVL